MLQNTHTLLSPPFLTGYLFLSSRASNDKKAQKNWSGVNLRLCGTSRGGRMDKNKEAVMMLIVSTVHIRMMHDGHAASPLFRRAGWKTIAVKYRGGIKRLELIQLIFLEKVLLFFHPNVCPPEIIHADLVLG